MPSDHAKISYLKSAIRILAAACLFGVDHHPLIWVFAVLFIIAEIIGIIEEFGH